jgi:hypothetical protein
MLIILVQSDLSPVVFQLEHFLRKEKKLHLQKYFEIFSSRQLTIFDIKTTFCWGILRLTAWRRCGAVTKGLRAKTAKTIQSKAIRSWTKQSKVWISSFRPFCKMSKILAFWIKQHVWVDETTSWQNDATHFLEWRQRHFSSFYKSLIYTSDFSCRFALS